MRSSQNIILLTRNKFLRHFTYLYVQINEISDIANFSSCRVLNIYIYIFVKTS